VTMDEPTRKEFLADNKSKEFSLLSKCLEELQIFDAPSAEKVFRQLVEELGVPSSELVHPVRLALTGKDVGPGLFETMVALGKEKTIKRLNDAFQGI
jgi:nondiscriminating glutamyl-tRNA synthetase